MCCDAHNGGFGPDRVIDQTMSVLACLYVHASAQICGTRLTMIAVSCRILVGPNASVMTNWLWNLLNVGVSLFGYHFAAFSIDWKWYGRKRMQVCKMSKP